MNSKTTKRALLSSAIALLICFTMMLSTTFAWFTDTAVSGSNVIVSGKLDVALVDEAGNSLEGEVIEWAAKDGRAQNEILWEPGCTYETEPFYVVNEGNLALKYQVVINGIDGDAKLLEAIEWTVTIDGVETDLATFEGKLYPTTAPKSGAIVLSGHMLEDAGNDYQDLTVNGISVSVFATQLDAETDSFGPEYDKDAVYGDYFVTDAAALADAFANAENGDVIALMADMDLTEKITVAKGKAVTLNLNGNDVSLVAPVADVNGDGTITSADNQMIFQVKGNLEVVGEGTVTMTHTGDDMGWNALSAAFSVEGGTLTLGEGVVVAHKGGTAMAYAVDVNTTLGNSTLNVDGALLSSTYTGVRFFNFNANNTATINLNSGVVDGAKRDIWKQADGPAVINIAEGLNYATEDGYIYNSTTSVAVDQTSLKNAANTKNSVVVLAPGEYETVSLAEGVTLIGSEGTVIKQAEGSQAALGSTKNTTIKNVEFVGTNAQRWGYAGGEVVFENCTFKGEGTDALSWAIHYDGLGGANIVYKNCDIYGWVAIGSGASSLVFDGCNFYGNGAFGLCRAYSDFTVKNCTFDYSNVDPNGTRSVGIEALSGATVTIENCTNVNGSIEDVISTKYFGTSYEGNVILNGVAYTPAP